MKSNPSWKTYAKTVNKLLIKAFRKSSTSIFFLTTWKQIINFVPHLTNAFSIELIAKSSLAKELVYYLYYKVPVSYNTRLNCSMLHKGTMGYNTRLYGSMLHKGTMGYNTRLNCSMLHKGTMGYNTRLNCSMLHKGTMGYNTRLNCSMLHKGTMGYNIWYTKCFCLLFWRKVERICKYKFIFNIIISRI